MIIIIYNKENSAGTKKPLLQRAIRLLVGWGQVQGGNLPRIYIKEKSQCGKSAAYTNGVPHRPKRAVKQQTEKK